MRRVTPQRQLQPATDALFMRYREREDVAARDELIAHFMPLARSIARRYCGNPDSFDDLLQVASVGLIKAVDRYEPDYGTAFSSFAVPSISGELKRHFRDTGWAVRVPRPLQDLVLKVDVMVDQLQSETGASPSPATVARALGEDVESVIEAMAAAAAHDSVSLDAPLDGGDGESADYASTVGEPDSGFAFVESWTLIRSAVRALPERDRQILWLRFGEDRTQAEIAQAIGVSQMHVSRLLRRILDRLRAAADD
jgi:RNA polymerase sigma-B factor